VEELSCVLNEATEKKDIKNIALTGPFGSGKSSILKTLRQNYRIFEYLPISLATLQADEQETDENLDDKQREARIENLNRKIEYSILQQLIYREKASTVPNSRFRRIAHIDKYNQCKYAFFCIGCLLAFIIAFEPAWLRIESLYNTFNFGSANIWFDVFAVGYLLFALYEIIKYIIKSYSNSKLNKLNLKDGEI
ncbi:YobI family P-loop NTPase, partial [Bacteroides thetaiotaomicron]